MAFAADHPDFVFGVVGAGAMGRGVAQLAAAAGCRTLLADARPGAAAEAAATVAAALRKLAERGKITAEAAEAAVARLAVADDLADFAPCHLVLEAIVEDAAAKQALFRRLEDVVGDDCVLATNTSSLSVTEIAAACRRPERVGGLHFFNPAPLMKLAEVIDGALTAPWVGDELCALTRRLGHTPVRSADRPGFIVNHAGRGYGTEALRALGEGVAEPAEIDRILRGAGFRMGPFELMDLTGLDVSQPVMEAIYRQFYDEPRFRPSPITRQRFAAGLLGRKTGRGFYVYDGDKQIPVPPPPVPAAKQLAVWAAPDDGGLAAAAFAALQGAEIDSGKRPAPDSLCVVSPWGEDCTAAALRHELDPRRTVAVDPLAGMERHRTVMVNPLTDPTYRDAAHAVFAGKDGAVSLIRDSLGFIAQRVLAAVVNIGCDIAQQRIAAPDDIDRAVTLGLGYPYGPLAWGDRIGPAKVLRILKTMRDLSGDPRWRPSLWLARRAALGVSLLTPEH